MRCLLVIPPFMQTTLLEFMRKFLGVRKKNRPHHDISFPFSFPWSSYKWSTLGKIDWPKSLESVAKDLIRKLLVIDRTKRIGNLKNGADDIKNHKWFKGEEKMTKWNGKYFVFCFAGIDWEDVYNKKLKPPFVPKVSSDGDTSNFQVNYLKWKVKWWKLAYFRNTLMRSWKLTQSLIGRRESSRNSRWKIIALPMAYPDK